MMDADGFVHIDDLGLDFSNRRGQRAKTPPPKQIPKMNMKTKTRPVVAAAAAGSGRVNACESDTAPTRPSGPAPLGTAVRGLSVTAANVAVSQLEQDLFPKITECIMTSNDAPPSAAVPGPVMDGPRPLTWHERILMFVPVVYEDLADWLNGQGVRTTIVRPPWPWLKRKWERDLQKVAKAAKAGLKSGPRDGRAGKRAVPVPVDTGGNDGGIDYNDDNDDNDNAGVTTRAGIPYKFTVRDNGMVEVPVEVKPWMVQKWCDASGVCGVWRDKRHVPFR